MFKELGAFIDAVGSITGRAIKEKLSDKDDKGGILMGKIIDSSDKEEHIELGFKENDNTHRQITLKN